MPRSVQQLQGHLAQTPSITAVDLRSCSSSKHQQRAEIREPLPAHWTRPCHALEVIDSSDIFYTSCLVLKKNSSCDISEKINWYHYSCAYEPPFPRVTFLNIQNSWKEVERPGPPAVWPCTYLGVNTLIQMHLFVFVLTTTNLHMMSGRAEALYFDHACSWMAWKSICGLHGLIDFESCSLLWALTLPAWQIKAV